MIDLEMLRAELTGRPQVKSAIPTAEGLEVMVRSVVDLYDDEALSRLAVFHPEFSIVRDNIQSLEQEHKYLVTEEYCRRLYHEPAGAFCDPFLSMGSASIPVIKAIREGNCAVVANMMIDDTRQINVLDKCIMDHVYKHFLGDVRVFCL